MKLRPHHLLCAQGYQGKGYSGDFVRNMDFWVGRLREQPDVRVRLVFSTDDLCACCPQNLGEGRCADQARVVSYDRKTVQYFHLEEKEYVYRDLARRIRAEMTPAMREDICGDCRWHREGICLV